MKQFWKISFFLLLFCCALHNSWAQHVIEVDVDQPPELKAKAGEDSVITEGENIVLGEDPTATGGYGGYNYSWQPVSSLDDASLANPVAEPSQNTTYYLVVSDKQECTAADTVFIRVDEGSGLKKAQEAHIEVYPNPASDRINIRIPPDIVNATLKLFNGNGHLIKNQRYQQIGNGKITLSCSDLQSGLYFLTIKINTETYIQQIIIH